MLVFDQTCCHLNLTATNKNLHLESALVQIVKKSHQLFNEVL